MHRGVGFVLAVGGLAAARLATATAATSHFGQGHFLAIWGPFWGHFLLRLRLRRAAEASAAEAMGCWKSNPGIRIVSRDR
jgi:hypothetical protein